jgi:hypothetical protein
MAVARAIGLENTADEIGAILAGVHDSRSAETADGEDVVEVNRTSGGAAERQADSGGKGRESERH